MWLEISNLRTRVVDASAEELRWIREYLSFEDKAAIFRKGRGRGRLPTINMFWPLANEFPAGFTDIVIRGAATQLIDVQTIDRRTRPCERDPQADLAWLRDYQLAAVDAACDKVRGIIQAPTGSGKTDVFAGLIRALPVRWLFLVHRNTLVEQAAERVERRTKLQVGRISEGRWCPWEKTDGVICGSFQTFSARLKRQQTARQAEDLLASAEAVFIDEVHTLPSESFWRIVMMTDGAYYRFGTSATPMARGDKKSIQIIGALGPVIHRVRTDLLIERQVLAKPRIRMLPVKHKEPKAVTWQGVYGECVVRSTKRNKLIIDVAQQAEKPCLVFVKEVDHGREVDKRLQSAGLNSAFVWGDHSTEWRRSAIKRLEIGALDVLVCSVVFQEGIDIPTLRSVVIGSGGKSVIAALQRIGRGMRVAKDKTTFDVYDFADKGHRWLENHTATRLKAYIREGHEVLEAPL